MVAIVVSVNLIIALACCYGAWRIWRLRRVLGQIANALVAWEPPSQQVLQPVLKMQANVTKRRDRYIALRLQLRQLKQILVLIGVGQRFWIRYRRGRPKRL